MILTLIGMSGAGKTFWATQLAAAGFAWLNCDALIADKLQMHTGPIGTSLGAIGQWLGFPDDANFRSREARYIACESDVLREVSYRAVSMATSQADWVIDTGGSAIYAETAIWEHLRHISTVVYLALPPCLYPDMVRSYLEAPRPLIWNGRFQQAPDEDRQAAFSRCYAQLVQSREQLYAQYQDVTLAYELYRAPHTTAARFLRAIQAAR